MTEEIKEKIKGMQIASGYVGKYSIGFEDKYYSIEFPVNSKLEDILNFISEFRDKVLEAIEEKNKKEKEELSKGSPDAGIPPSQ